MRNIFERHPVFFGTALAMVIVSLMAGCDNDTGGNTNPVDPPEITVEVRINSSTNDVLRGGEVTFLASVKGTDDKKVTWSIDEKDKHQETKIDINNEGVICLSVSEDETLGTLTVRAVSEADPEKSGTLKVTIPVPTVEKVEISLLQPWVVPWEKKVDTGPGGAIEFTVKVTGKDFIREAVTWSIDNAGKQANTTINIDENGVAQLRVASNEILTSFKVRAVSKWDAGKIGEVTVTVKEPTVIGVVIYDQDGKVVSGSSQNPKMIKASDSESFRAVVTGTGKVNQNVTWEIERLTYIISVEEIRQDKDGNWTDGWASTQLEIILDDDTEEFTWVKTGEITEFASIYEKKPIERISGSKEVKIWVTDYDDEGEIVNEQITLIPTTGATEIDATGMFTVDSLETFGKFKLTVVSTADTTIKKEVTVQIDSSSQIGIEPPPEF
jgi:hypothetical protein